LPFIHWLQNYLTRFVWVATFWQAKQQHKVTQKKYLFIADEQLFCSEFGQNFLSLFSNSEMVLDTRSCNSGLQDVEVFFSGLHIGLHGQVVLELLRCTPVERISSSLHSGGLLLFWIPIS
jgi:hypothetical protein